MAKLYGFVVESKLKTANTMMNLDAKDRYLLFLKLYSGLANRVPLAMLASYLGITASSLSRIRKISNPLATSKLNRTPNALVTRIRILS
jgi:hypothetical protein